MERPTISPGAAPKGLPSDELSLHQTFTGPLSTVYVSKDIQVNGGTSQQGSAAISAVYQTFSQVPEPATLALLALGFGGMTVLRRRRKQS